MKKRTKKTLQVALKLLLRLLVAVILCAILNVSMNVIGTAFFSDVVGYQVFEQDENEKVNLIEEHYYEPGEKPVTADDLELKDNQAFSAIRVVGETKKNVLNAISQILMLIIWGIFPYHILWEFGNRDDTNVRYRGQRPDPWRGVRIGALATAPFAIAWVLLVLAKFNVLAPSYIQIYRLISFPFLPYVNWIFGSAQSAVDVAIWRVLLLIPTLMFVPAVAGVAYKLGGRQFSVSEFITFKKNNNSESEEEI